MKSLELDRAAIDLGEYKSRTARESDASRYITESCVVTIRDVPSIVYLSRLDDGSLDELDKCVHSIKYVKDIRTNGLVTNSRIFGYAPRNPLRNHPCRVSSWVQDQPSHHALLMQFASVVAGYYRQHLPEEYDRHDRAVSETVKESYRIRGTPFTSGIVNKNNPLRYHFDSGNFDGMFSAMVAFRSGVSGGDLCMPELDARFKIGDRSLILFDGQGLLHGVTPIVLSDSGSYRYTIVYYSLKALWNCEELRDEIIRMRNKRTQQETKRAENG